MDLLSRILTLTDHTRLPQEDGERAGWYKEWFHFCILSDQVQAIINFSMVGDNRPAALPGARQARVTLLLREERWHGDLYEIQSHDIQLNPGRIDLRFGQNRLHFHDGVFRVTAALESRPVTVDLAIRPVTYPLLRTQATIGSGSIDWLVVPRLQASGTIVSGRRVIRLQDAPTYHDHNWGHWLWGQDFAWQWGFALPVRGATPWSLVFESMTNRARSQVQQLKLCLWKGDRLVRIFAQRDIRVRPQGFLSLGAVAKFPPIMALLAPETTSDVPHCLDVEASSGDDRLRFHFEAQDLAQIVIPNETDLGETIINESNGRLSTTGRVKGEDVHIDGEGFFEFLT